MQVDNSLGVPIVLHAVPSILWILLRFLQKIHVLLASLLACESPEQSSASEVVIQAYTTGARTVKEQDSCFDVPTFAKGFLAFLTGCLWP